MKILLTGISGFLGGHLTRALVNDGHKVIGLKRHNSDITNLTDIVDQINIINIEDSLDSIFDNNTDIDIVIHAATNYGKQGEFLSDIMLSNVIFPLKIMEKAYLSNTFAFINTDTFFSKDENKYSYLAEYTQTKRIFNKLGTQYSKNKNRTFINMQLEHMYGVGDALDKFIPNIIKNMLENVPDIKLTPGDQMRDFVYIDDVVSAFLTIINSADIIQGVGIKNFEVGRGSVISVKEFVKIAHKLTESKSRLIFGDLPYRENEIMHSKANLDNLYQLGWESKISIEQGLSRVIAAMRH